MSTWWRVAAMMQPGRKGTAQADDPAQRGCFIAALRRKIELSWHPERLATADKTR
jgi:hypothetical protein